MFLPTAVKFHYIFNLRDLSNCFQGLLFSGNECLQSSTDLMRLWFHETQRVYGDKLIDEKDIESFSKLQLDILKKNVEEIDESAVLEKPNIYCHFAGKYFLRKMSHRVSRLIIILSRLRFLNKLPRVVTAITKNEWRKRFEGGVGEPKYMAVKDWSTLHRLLSEAMVSYNDLVAAMKLVLFEDAMMHVCRINRILESPRGSALLVGVGGSGKQSLSRLAAFISSLEVFQIQLKKGYGIADMKSELAALYNKSGLKNLGIVFLMTDAQVANEQFLVLINDMLASGEVPDLFAEDELENIIAGCWTNISLYRCIFHPLPHPRIETILSFLFLENRFLEMLEGAKGDRRSYLEEYLRFRSIIYSLPPPQRKGSRITRNFAGVRNEVKGAGILDTRENCWKFFIDRVRRQLRTVLCFSPVGSTLRIRSRKFPAIINCTAINWFHEWPQEALMSVSKRFLQELDELPGTYR